MRKSVEDFITWRREFDYFGNDEYVNADDAWREVRDKTPAIKNMSNDVYKNFTYEDWDGIVKYIERDSHHIMKGKEITDERLIKSLQEKEN